MLLSRMLSMVFLAFCSYSYACTPQAVFMKFHKVGSETVHNYFNRVNSLKTSWKGLHCNVTSPSGHEVLNLYMKYGREGIINQCIVAPESFCRVSNRKIYFIFDSFQKGHCFKCSCKQQ